MKTKQISSISKYFENLKDFNIDTAFTKPEEARKAREMQSTSTAC
jgi:hypothetical protein